MCAPRSCCCCSLRTGCVLSAIWTILIGTAGAITTVIRLLVMMQDEEQRRAYAEQNDPACCQSYFKAAKDTTVNGAGAFETTLKIQEIVFYIYVGVFALWVLVAFIMFIAICTFHRCLLLPWLITTPLMTALSAWSISTVVKKLVAGQEFLSFTVLDNTAFIMFCLLVIVNIYAFFMVSHYYKRGLREDEERYAECHH